MPKNRVLALLAVLPLVGLAACGGGDEQPEADANTTTEIITQQDSQQVEVMVPTTDTMAVQRTVDVDTSVTVDTIQNPPSEKRNP